MNDIYITTTIPYVNAKPHVGFALELVQADTLARYHRLRGHNVRFQTGTDENALKNVLAAERQGLSPQQLVDRNAAVFERLAAKLEVSHDRFLRTTEPAHHDAVERFWASLPSGYLYRRAYSGRYCVACEDFLGERDLEGDLCPEHRTTPAVVEEENDFFRLSAFQTQLEELLESDRLRVVPETRKQEVLAFVRRGLCDISISRDATRFRGWGIPVPGVPSRVVYVWIDALVNYCRDWATVMVEPGARHGTGTRARSTSSGRTSGSFTPCIGRHCYSQPGFPSRTKSWCTAS